MTTNSISFVIPSRDNLADLKISYASIRKNAGNDIWICMADDNSHDGTWDWMENQLKLDNRLKALRNDTGKRVGHTVLYDRIIDELVETEYFMIFHADMYLLPGALDAVLPYLNHKTIVSLTRVEPPLHPAGIEKIQFDCGIDSNTFDEKKLLDWYAAYEKTNKVTDGIFAPWCCAKDSFVTRGGHSALYKPQSKEDSSWFNRWVISGGETIQTWNGLVYHTTCKGSRFNPTLTTVGKESSEWLTQNMISSRNFIREWGSFVKHSPTLRPIVPPKYNTAFIVRNCNPEALVALEPWCDRIYVDLNDKVIDDYIKSEQERTLFDMKERVHLIGAPLFKEIDIYVNIDLKTFNQNDWQVISNLSEIIKDSGEIGKFELGNLQIEIFGLTEHQNELIKCTNNVFK